MVKGSKVTLGCPVHFVRYSLSDATHLGFQSVRGSVFANTPFFLLRIPVRFPRLPDPALPPTPPSPGEPLSSLCTNHRRALSSTCAGVLDAHLPEDRYKHFCSLGKEKKIHPRTASLSFHGFKSASVTLAWNGSLRFLQLGILPQVIKTASVLPFLANRLAKGVSSRGTNPAFLWLNFFPYAMINS